MYKSSCILLDINTYDIQKKEIKHYGFAVYPLSEAFQNRIYFLSGVSQLVVYKGAVPAELTDTLCNNPNLDPLALL